MGRRMKSTKSGKYINPTDQARKEARKRELKKNKKQRLIVRVAVLKGKDPFQIIADLERLDRMEYDFYNPSPLNEKVLKDKRRKLKDTWDRICRLYIKEDKEKYQELKRMEGDYEAKRNELVKQYEAIKSAQEVNIEDIPLPSAMPSAEPSNKTMATPSILKNTKTRTKQPPGCPPGLPPLLKDLISDDEDDDDDDDDDEESDKETETKKVRFSDEVDDKSKEGNNLLQFLQEIEQLSTEKTKNQKDSNETVDFKEDTVPKPAVSNIFMNPSSVQPAPPIIQTTLRPPPPTPSVSLVPPMPLPPPIPIPPPSSQMISRLPISVNSPMYAGHHQQSNSKKNFETNKKPTATIEARPQLRNLSADSTKFMPLALRVKRDEKQAMKKSTISKPTTSTGVYGMINSYSSSSNIRSSTVISGQTSTKTTNKDKTTNSKDDAYEQFMKEMNGLI